MDEVTEKIEDGFVPDEKNIRFPVLTTQQYVDRIIKNLRNRNIAHMVRQTVGGYKYQVCLHVGYSEIYFWVVDEETWLKTANA
jgi:hypothetical protein